MSGDPVARTETMARILNVSTVHLGRLAKEGSIPEPVERGRWDVIATTNAFIRYIEGKSEKQGDVKSEELRLTIARREKTEAEKIAQEMKNAEAQGELLRRTDVTAVVTAAFARVRARLISIPAKLAPALVGETETVAIKEKIEDGVNEALAELAETRVVGVSADRGEPDGD